MSNSEKDNRPESIAENAIDTSEIPEVGKEFFRDARVTRPASR